MVWAAPEIIGPTTPNTAVAPRMETALPRTGLEAVLAVIHLRNVKPNEAAKAETWGVTAADWAARAVGVSATELEDLPSATELEDLAIAPAVPV